MVVKLMFLIGLFVCSTKVAGDSELGIVTSTVPKGTKPTSKKGKKERGSPACRWCFTVNNWTEEEYGLIVSTCKSSAKYLIIGKEVGENGTPHLQGFVNFKKKLRLSGLKKLPGFTRAHVEIAMGSDLENQKYCRKGNQYLEIGVPSSRGKSSSLRECLDLLLKEKGDLKKAANEYPEVFVRHHRGLRDYISTAGLIPVRQSKSYTIVLIGPPGVGKTRKAVEMCGERPIYWKPRGMWWDGYKGEDCVIIDDFYGWIPFSELLRVLDRYPLQVQVKGSFVEFVADFIVITSNVMPEEWYNKENIHGDVRAMFRRFNEMYVWNEKGEMKEAEPMYQINF
nr:MAG: replication-associated protein [Canine circovirus]WDW25744.1 MAG: replication-associated protein [Canine circovirus]